MRGKYSPAVSGLEYEIEHSPNVKFSEHILHNNTVFIQKCLGTQGSNNLFPFPNKIVPGTIRFGQNYLWTLFSKTGKFTIKEM